MVGARQIDMRQTSSARRGERKSLGDKHVVSITRHFNDYSPRSGMATTANWRRWDVGRHGLRPRQRAQAPPAGDQKTTSRATPHDHSPRAVVNKKLAQATRYWFSSPLVLENFRLPGDSPGSIWAKRETRAHRAYVSLLRRATVSALQREPAVHRVSSQRSRRRAESTRRRRCPAPTESTFDADRPRRDE